MVLRSMALRRLVGCLAAVLGAAAMAPAAAAEPPKVGTKPFPPFVFERDAGEQPTGYSIELWQRMAQKLGYETTFVTYDSLPAGLAAVESGQVDAAIAGISITAERERRLDFSYGYYTSGLQVAVTDRSQHPAAIVHHYLLAPEILRALAITLGIAFVSANAFWFFERHHHPDLPHQYWRGVGEGLWWAIVTATTVGYGDRVPRTVPGRLVAIAWMLSGIVVFAYVTATLAASRHRPLQGSRTCTVSAWPW